MKAKFQEMMEKVDKHRIENDDFIVLHAGIAKYRSMRVFLIGREPRFEILLYDIIIPRMPKQTSKSIKQETLKKIKADLGALTEAEKEEMKQEMAIQLEFLENPFFYADIGDMLVDLNFKHYLQTEFNAVIIENGEIVNSFDEIDEHYEYIYVAKIVDQRDQGNVFKIMKKIAHDRESPNIFYTMYRNVLDKKTIPLQLENFSETPEFFEGLDPGIQKKCKVSPLKAKQFDSDHPEIVKHMNKKNISDMQFAKCLNKNPLRIFSPTNSSGILPTLPQRYVIDKQNFKIPPLRHV